MGSKPVTNTPLGASAWYSSSWTYSIPIKFKIAQIPGALANFPVLINITSSSLQSNALSTGNDIIFVSADNSTKYAHEIEYYSSTNGHLVAWVNVTSLSSTSNTVIYMYYGNADATNQQNKYGTWNSNYVGVWHLTNSTSDSTSNKANATTTTTTASAKGRISACQDWEADSSQYIEMASSASWNFGTTTAFTMECWVCYEGFTDLDDNAFEFFGTYDGDGWQNYVNFAITPDRVEIWSGSGTTRTRGLPESFVVGKWYYVTITRPASDTAPTFYLNGNSVGAYSSSNNDFNNDANPLCLGADPYNSGGRPCYAPMDGRGDEFRISKGSACSANWIKTSFNNVVNATDGGFYVLGSVNTYAPPWTNVAPYAHGEHPSNNSINQPLRIACGGMATDGNSNQTLTVTFAENTSGGTWINRQTNDSLANNSKVNCTFKQFNTGNTKYWWRMYVNDGLVNKSFTYKFTTTVNATIRANTQIFDNYFNCGNTTRRGNINIFSYYFLVGNATSRNNVNIFSYYFIGGNVTHRQDTKTIDYYFICSNTSFRSNTQVLDYYFNCGNSSGRVDTQIFDEYFLCGNGSIRKSNNIFDNWYLCGNDTLRTPINIFDSYFICNNNTLRNNANIFSYYFIGSNSSSRNDYNVFNYYLICGNTSSRSDTDIFGYWFICRNESDSITLSNPSPSTVATLSINPSNISGHTGDLLISIQRNNSKGYLMNTSIWFNNTFLFKNNSWGNGTITFWLFDYYNGTLHSGTTYNWTVNCSSDKTYTNTTYNLRLNVNKASLMLPVGSGLTFGFMIGLIVFAPLFIVWWRKRKKKE